MITEESVKELLELAGIKEEDSKIEKIVNLLDVEEVEEISDLRYLKNEDIADIFGYKKVKVAKLVEAVKKLNRKEVKVEIPKMPKDLSSIKLEVTGKTEIDVERIVNFIEMAMLSGMNIDKIGQEILLLVEQRMKELEEPANNRIIEIYKLVAKFRNFDENVAAVLDFNLSLLPKRHQVVKEIKNKMVPSIVGFINEALNFRISMSDFNSIILAKNLKTKKVEDVNIDNLIIASEDLAVNTNKVFAGLNNIIVNESLKLYKEVFELLNDKNLQEFLGAKDTRDLMRKLDIDYTPKDVKSFELLKELIYQMLIVLENDELATNPDMLYSYLQNVWNKSKSIDWNKILQVNEPYVKEKNTPNEIIISGELL